MLLPIHAAATLLMAGIIWFVQVVHYPLMAEVAREGFRDYEADHTSRTTWVVALPMLAELVTGLLLAWRPPEGIPAAGAWTGLALIIVIWISTGLVQVPAHWKLALGFDAAVHRRLVATNWIRTVAWSLRALLVLSWLS